MEDIIYALIPIVGILSVAGVIIFRPLTKKLGEFLEFRQQERSTERLDEEARVQVRRLIGALESRMNLIEQRLDFTESLIENRGLESLPRPADVAPEEEA